MKTIARWTGAALATVALSAGLATPATAAGGHTTSCYDQHVFTGRDGHVFDLPGGQYVGIWFGGYKINVHSDWDRNWFGGNVYAWDGTYRSTGYVLKQYTRYSRTICN